MYHENISILRQQSDGQFIGVGAAAAEAAMAAPLFARNNVSSMASEVAEPPHFLLPY